MARLDPGRQVHRRCSFGRGARRVLLGCRRRQRCCWSPLVGVLTGIGFAALGMWFSAMATTFDDLSYVISGVITPLFLVAGTFFPLDRLPDWLRTFALFNPLYHCVELVRHCAFGLRPGPDAVHVAALVVFGLVAWVLAVRRTRVRLIV